MKKLFLIFVYIYSFGIFADANEDLLNAVKTSQLQKIKDAVDLGGDLNSKDSDETPIIILALKKKNKQVIQYLYSQEIDFKVKDAQGNGVLHFLSGEGDTKLLEDSIAKGLNVNEINMTGLSPLHISIIKKQTKNALSLLNAKADLEQKDGEGNSPLLLAFINKQKQVFDELLKAGANPASKDRDGNTLLHLYLLDGNIKEAKNLISSTPSLLNEKNNLGKTPLIPVIEKNKEASINFLISEGVDISARDNSGQSAIHYIAKSNFTKLISIFISKGANPNEKDTNGTTPIFGSIGVNKINNIKELLLAGADPNLASSDGLAPLVYAFQNKRADIFKLLLDNKADPNLRTPEGRPILIEAIIKNDSNSFNLLLANKADPNSIAPDKDTALIYTIKLSYSQFIKPLATAGANLNGTGSEGKLPLLIAHENLVKGITNSRYSTFKEVLNAGANPNINTSAGKPIITEYVERGNADIVKFLAEKNADLSIKDKIGNNLLHIAINFGKEDVCRVLLDKGLDVNSLGEGGNTPITLAALAGKNNLVSLFIKKGGDPNLKNGSGDTAIAIAVGKQDLRTAKELVNGNADLTQLNGFGNPLLIEVAKAEPGNSNFKNALEMISLLTRGGALVNIQNIYGNTAMVYAINRKNTKLVEFFLKEGANVSIADKAGNTALHKLAYTAVYDKLKNKELDDLISLLLEYGADLNVVNYAGETPLHILTKPGLDKDNNAAIQASRRLLDYSASAEIKDKDGNTAYDYAKKNESKELLDVIKSNLNQNKLEDAVELPNSSASDKIISLKTDGTGNMYGIMQSGDNYKFIQFSSSGKKQNLKDLTEGNDVFMDEDGSYYVAGTFPGSVDGKKDTSCKEGENRVVSIRKFSKSGEEVWYRTISERGACSKTNAIGIFLDSEKNVYGVVNFVNTFYLYKFTNEGIDSWKERLGENAKKWSYSFGAFYYFGSRLNRLDLETRKTSSVRAGTANDSGFIPLEDGGFVSVSKAIVAKTNSIVVTKYDKSGKTLWSKRFTSGGEDNPSGIATDSLGNFYIFGETKGSLHGKKNLGYKDSFLMKLNSEGNRIWTETIGGEGEEASVGFVSNNSGGFFFGTTDEKTKFTSPKGGVDGFLIKVNQ